MLGNFQGVVGVEQLTVSTVMLEATQCQFGLETYWFGPADRPMHFVLGITFGCNKWCGT